MLTGKPPDEPERAAADDVHALGLRVSGFRASGLGFRTQGLGSEGLSGLSVLGLRI